MKRILLFLALAAILASCSSKKGYFTIEGRFLNMNQGELYVYSSDGLTNGVDTIKVNGGRFAMQIPCARSGQLTIVFPNFSEQPIFAEAGKSVDIKADASHLKEMEITGTDDNELMTTFRKSVAAMSPPETVNQAENFIRDNAKSPVAIYLLRKYFIGSGNVEYIKKGKELLSIVALQQPKATGLKEMQDAVKMLLATSVGGKIPQFKAISTDGNVVTNATFKGKKLLVCTWASWSYDSENFLRTAMILAQDGGGNTDILGLNLDACVKDCKAAMLRDRFNFTNVCDGELFNSKLLAALGFHAVPENFIVGSGGRILAKNVTIDELEKYMK